MTSVRYSAGKIWANFACAIAGGLVAVIVLGSLWHNSALIGGIAGMITVLIMLLPGVIKRSARTEPFLVIDGRGVTIDLLGIGTIPWSQIKSARISGIPWVTGQRLILEYAGTGPKAGFMAKLNWGIQSKNKGDMARVSVGFLDLTDQSKQVIEGALSPVASRAA